MHEPPSSDEWEELYGKVQGLGGEIEKLRVAQDQRSEVLDHELRSARIGIKRVEELLSDLSSVQSQSRDAIRAVGATADATHLAFSSFVERYGRDQLVANAQAELSRLTAEWTARFAERRRIRALARGLTHALTEGAVARGLVDAGTIETCGQEQLIVEPTFWLAPAVVAVAAGYRRDADRAARARSHALTLDQAKATLFFALTCSRQKRQGEAARWMDRYLAGLDPDDLGPEFTVVLDAVAGAELGYEALTYAQQAMIRWDREANARLFGLSQADSAAARLARWRPWMLAPGTDGSRQFPVLRKLCKSQWVEAEQGWTAALAVERTLEYLRGEYSTNPSNAMGEHRTSAALSHLINQLDPDESRMQEQMDRLRSVIRHRGDMGAASADFPDADDAVAVDFQALLERAIFEPESVSLGYPARLMVLHSAWPSLRLAVTTLAEQSGELLPEKLTLAADGWACQLPADPVGSEISDRLIGELQGYLERRTEESIKSVVPVWTRIASCFVAALACSALVVVLDGWTSSLAKLLAVLLFGGAIWGLAHVPVRRHLMREDGTRFKTENTALLKVALGQQAQMLRQWKSGLAAAAQSSSWSPAADEWPKSG